MSKTLAILSFGNSSLWLPALVALGILGALSWLAWRTPYASRRDRVMGISLRALGIALLALALLDPQWSVEEPSAGANIVAVVIDNSQGLQVIGDESQQSRGTTLAGNLAKGNWLAKLEQLYQVRNYQFDTQLERVSDFDELNFDGELSSLNEALQSLKSRYVSRPLAAVVLITDGIATDLSEGTIDLEGLPPVYPLAVGDDEPLRPDLSLDRVELSQTAFDDAPVTVRTLVSYSGTEKTSATVNVRPLTDSASLLTESQSQELSFGQDRAQAIASFDLDPKDSGIKFFAASAELPPTEDGPAAEATSRNNEKVFLIDRGAETYRILYVTGRPNWEYKFLNRALADDPQLELVALARVARREPKFEFKGRSGESSNPLFRGFDDGQETAEQYDQPVLIRLNTQDREELQGGFPTTEADLFAYDGIIIDDLEADFFSLKQLSLIRRFASDRGGGLLFLGGADALDNGGYERTPLAAALPIYLDSKRANPGGELRWRLTREGWVEPWARVRPKESDEAARLDTMPPFLVLNAFGRVKPGARVLAVAEDSSGETYPGLVAQNFGYGRVACIALGDLWRWGLRGPAERKDLARLWRQSARWLVSDAPRRVSLAAFDSGRGAKRLVISAKDEAYRPLALGRARLTIRKLPDGSTDEAGFEQVELAAEPVADKIGAFEATFNSQRAGAYLATVEVLRPDGSIVGKDEAGWVVDPAAAEFRTLAPDVELLQEIARGTGGKLLAWKDLDNLSQLVARNPAPIMETVSKPIWHSGWFFITALACLLGEWGLRRWKCLV